MLPEDDQLIPYGLDSTVSIVRTFPNDLQHSKVEDVTIDYIKNDSGLKPTGITLKYHDFKGTQYVIKNNSTDRTVNKFYIDHTANTAHGGFVIVTTDREIKRTTGWTRYGFALKPQEELAFVVRVEASHVQSLSVANLQIFVDKSAPKLLDEKVLKPDVLEKIKKMVQNNKLVSALQMIKSENLQERTVLAWQQANTITDKDMLKNLLKAVEMAKSTEETGRKITSHEDYIKQVFQNQSRLRENIKSLEKVSNSSLVERYLKDLNQEEDNLIKARQAIDNLDKQKREAQAQLKTLQLNLSAEASKMLEHLDV